MKITQVDIDAQNQSFDHLMKAIYANLIIIITRITSILWSCPFSLIFPDGISSKLVSRTDLWIHYILKKKEVSSQDFEVLQLYFILPCAIFMIYLLKQIYLAHSNIKKLKIRKSNVLEAWYPKLRAAFYQKQDFTKTVGLVVLWCDIFILTFKHVFLTKPSAFYIGYLELVIATVFVCIFNVHNAKFWIACLLVSITILWAKNYEAFTNDDGFGDNLATLLNSCLAASFIMVIWQAETKESLKDKRQLEDKEDNLKEILNMFPSGILFYDQHKGIIYKNEKFKEICGLLSSQKENGKVMEKSRSEVVLNKKSSFSMDPPDYEDDRLSKSSKEVLCYFTDKDQKCTTLEDNLRELSISM